MRGASAGCILRGMTANRLVTQVIDQERRRRGLTQAQLARLLGMSEMTLSRRLNNKPGYAWQMDDLDVVSQRLGIPLPVLLMEPVVTLQCRNHWVVTRWYRSQMWPTLQAA